MFHKEQCKTSSRPTQRPSTWCAGGWTAPNAPPEQRGQKCCHEKGQNKSPHTLRFALTPRCLATRCRRRRDNVCRCSGVNEMSRPLGVRSGERLPASGLSAPWEKTLPCEGEPGLVGLLGRISCVHESKVHVFPQECMRANQKSRMFILDTEGTAHSEQRSSQNAHLISWCLKVA